MTETMKNLDVPLKRLLCRHCKREARPDNQIRLTADKCGQPTAVIVWDCSICGRENLTADDISILDSEIIL